METNIDNEIIHNLQILEDNGLNNRKIVLFGAGVYSQRLYGILEGRGLTVFTVIDNNKSRANSKIGKVRVQHTSSFFDKYDDTYIFLILSDYYKEMKNQLERHGYIENVHIFKMAKLDWHVIDSRKMEECLSNIKDGRKLHKQLLNEYGEDIKIMLNPTTSIGDIYLMGFYVKQYLESHKNCLFICGNTATQQLASALGFGQVIYMPYAKVTALIIYARVCGFDKVNMELLHTGHGAHFRIWSRMMDYAGLNWMEQCRELFELPKDTKPEIQTIHAESNIDDIFKNYQLVKGKTVILAPNAKAFSLLEDRFWELLAKELKSMGYCVCTNVSSDSEKGVNGTIPIFVKIRDMNEFVDKSGFFIGLRSGLCDVLCNSSCKKIILYSGEWDGFMSLYDFFSLKGMGFDKNLSEYIVNEENEKDILERIVEEMRAGNCVKI